MLTVTGFENIQLHYLGKRSQLFRATESKTDDKVFLKTQVQDHPDFKIINQYRQAYELSQLIHNSHVIAHLDMQQIDQRLLLVIEDYGAVALDSILPQSGLSLDLFFKIARQVATGLQAIHDQNIVHKDVKPSNIVINQETGLVKIIDLGTAVKLNLDAKEIHPTINIEGTLAYISPEQTGRMNQIVDYRSDLYSLGVTFYELLTGKYPFVTDDPLRMIHSHIALLPVLPHLTKPALPEMVSKIVMKLLAKNAEDRYQSCAGLLADLLLCEESWLAYGRIEPFPLDQAGQPDDFQKIQKLYSRFQALAEQEEVGNLTPHKTTSTTDSTTFYANELDMMTVLKASQTLSGELELNRLLSRMMRIVIESAGAQMGHLILKSNDHLLIAATARAAHKNIEITHSVSAPKAADLALSVVQAVLVENKPIILTNAVGNGRFTSDPYIQQKKAKSILCLPMHYKGKISGVLYIENNLIRGAFTRKQVEVLQFLIAQAAISLENAYLYEDFSQSIIEYKRTETELRNSEARLTMAIEAGNLGIWDWDIATNTITWSEHVDSLFGLPPGDFDGSFKMYLSLIHPDDVSIVQKTISTALAVPNIPYHVTHRIICPNGDIRWLEASGKVHRLKNGEPYRMTGYVMDITQRKEQENRERERQGWLQRVMELGKVITAVTDWDECLQTLRQCVQSGLQFDRVGIFIYDQATEMIQGIYGTDANGKQVDTTWYNVNINNDPGFARVLSNPQGFQYVENLHEAIPREEGHEMFGITEHVTVAVWAGDKPLAAITADNGIYQRRMEEMQIEALRLFVGYAGFALENARLLEQLHEQEEQLRLALSAANMGTWNWQIPSNKVTWSEHVTYLHGFEGDSDFNNTNAMLWSSIVESDVKPLQKALQSTLENPNPPSSFHEEYRINLKDGTIRWLEVMGRRIDDKDGRPLRIAGTIADITSRKNAEIEREQLIEELESRNAELERFTYTVSHDLKSPLITIRGFLGLLERDIEQNNQEKIERDMERIHAAAGKMLNLLDDLLELSRIGRLTNPSTAVSVNDLATEAIELVTGRISERNVQIIVQPNCPSVFVDKPRVVEVFQNLLDNAVKFMGDEPNPTIHIGAMQDETKIVCFVKDNGLGIEPKYLERVFNLFERLNPSVDGTGVGLALIKRIIEFHNGRIWAESEGQGQGTTFYFTLPAVQTD